MSLTYEHIVSRGAYGEIGNGVYQRLREAHREVWFGTDGSGLIKEALIRSSFFTDEQRKRWENDQHSAVRDDPTPSLDLFAPGCLHGHGPLLSKLPSDPSALARELKARQQLTLHGIGQLMGEALVPDGLGHALHTVAAQLPDAEILELAADELGRSGHGIARIEHGRRVELIFAPNSPELLANREALVDHTDFAPAGAIIGWTSYLSREIVDSLPDGTPPIPGPPCRPPGSGRGTVIEHGFLLSTGYFTDLGPQLENWRAEGIITEAQYDVLKDHL